MEKRHQKKCAKFSYEKQTVRRRWNPHSDARLVGMPCAKVIIWRSHLVAVTPPFEIMGRGRRRSSAVVVISHRSDRCDTPPDSGSQNSTSLHFDHQPHPHQSTPPSAQTMKTQLDETRQWWALKKSWKKNSSELFPRKLQTDGWTSSVKTSKHKKVSETRAVATAPTEVYPLPFQRRSVLWLLKIQLIWFQTWFPNDSYNEWYLSGIYGIF